MPVHNGASGQYPAHRISDLAGTGRVYNRTDRFGCVRQKTPSAPPACSSCVSDGDFSDPPAGRTERHDAGRRAGRVRWNRNPGEHHVYLSWAAQEDHVEEKDRTVPDYSMAEIYRDAERGRNFHHALGTKTTFSAVGELLEWSKSSRVKIRRIFLPDVALKDEVLETLLQQIEEADVSVEYLSAGEHMTDGALQISCLHPYAKKVPEDRRNDASLVLRLSQGDFQMLLTGDLEKSGEDWLVEQARPAVTTPSRWAGAGTTRRGAVPDRCAGAGTPVCTVNPARCAGAGTPALHRRPSPLRKIPSAAPSSTPGTTARPTRREKHCWIWHSRSWS